MSESPKPSPLQGVNVLLEGPSGTGKTYALFTLVEWCKKNNIEVFALFVGNGLETLLGAWADRGLSIPDNLRWMVVKVRPLPFASLKEVATKVGQLTYESITKIVDHTRSQNNAFEAILTACTSFTDDRTGKGYGSVDGWGPEKVFIIDELTELSNAAMKMVIGNKPTASQPDYGVAQNNLMNMLRLCTQGCPCHFVLTAHVSRERNEIDGSVKLMTKAIGTAISVEIPPLFSDVIYTYREGSSWYWDTANVNVDLKTRNLPVSSRLSPDFAQILDKWAARAKAGGAK